MPKKVSAYALPELGKDIIGLMDHFGIEKVNLTGHDWGAFVAWGMAITFPERVKKLAILNVPHPLAMSKFLRKSPKQTLKSLYIGFFQIPGLADWLMGLGNFAGAINMLRASGKRSTFSEADLAGYREAYSRAGGLTGMINWYRALAQNRPSMPGKVRLEMPVLIQWGRQDMALSAEMAEESLKYCKNGRLIFFDDATHWVQHDRAEDVTRELLNFFANTEHK